MTGKQKRYLRSIGSTIEPIVQIGKGGVAQPVIESAKDALLARELIKVRVLQNSPEEPPIAIAFLAESTGAELVQVIGRNGLLYKRNQEKPKLELP
ncbi:YhbY family RNA-binding protein [Lucifera butyrica]|uniref:YhbY family RNA-binding protein n=1 Tax=Lucifera butyrica TaxID=1351585 RepID=UPI001A9F83EF|nr:YhbY family RNA-binding protein [Lucifera butyrica]